jgi:thiol:disulfide interchange protein DsbA
MGRLTIFTAFLAISLPLAIPLPATAEITVPIVAKMHYEAIETPLTTEDSDRVEVTEFFSYACVHCYNFDPVLDAWRSRQPADVAFRRVPAIFYESWKPFAQAYYTAVALGIAEESHMAFFEAVHVEQRQLLKPRDIASFYAQFGVSEADFLKTYNSFGIRSRVQNAMAHSRAYGTGVPTVIVNGKYRVHGRLDGLQGKGFEDLLAVVDFLVEQERKAETQ